MVVKLKQYADIGSEDALSSEKHVLLVLDENAVNNFPFAQNLQNKLTRSKTEFTSLNKDSVNIELPNGGLASFVILPSHLNVFQQHTLLRKAIKPLLDEKPQSLAICVFGDEVTRKNHASAAYYVATVNAAILPVRKKKINMNHLM